MVKGIKMEKGDKFYVIALLLAALGVLCVLGFLVHESLTTVMVAGAGFGLISLGVLSLLWGIYSEYKETGSIKEALGLE
ncbi:MAG: hypothetical protein QMC78_00080 [Methanocellales archaeon]|nr:hypothetical protein [Methanocellales archaeon]